MQTDGHILVFGAYGYVGKAWCSALEKAGYRVLRGGRKAEQHPDVQLDFTRPDTVNDVEWRTLPTLSGVYFLQGINPHQGVHEISIQDFQCMLSVNLTTPSLIIQQLNDRLAEHASIVFMSSVARRKGSYDPSYAAAKSGLTGLMHSLANALPKQRFNAISLGLVENSPVYENMTEDFRQRHRSRMRAGRLIQLEEVISTLQYVQDNQGIHRELIALEGGFQS